MRLAGFLATLAITGTTTVAGGRRAAGVDVIYLPVGFNPEGIAKGRGDTFYTGSLTDGSIYEGNLTTGEGEIVLTDAGGGAHGMYFDERSEYLFVAGNLNGSARVYDDCFDLIADFQLSLPGESYVNDVVVTENAAYFTDSYQAQIYAVGLDSESGELLDVVTIELSNFPNTPYEINGNGIEYTAEGMIIMSSSYAQQLFAVDPETGEATVIDLGGDLIGGADGLILKDHTLWVVGTLNPDTDEAMPRGVIEITLSDDLQYGAVERVLVSDDFNFPTTAVRFKNSIYAVNAKFETVYLPEVIAETIYEVVRVDI